MADGLVTTALYVAACLVIPFVWGVFIHGLFHRFEVARARRRAQRGGAPARPASGERTSTMWDYQI